jgi:hypothetical protein
MTDDNRIESNTDAANSEPPGGQPVQPSAPSPPKDIPGVTIVDVTRPGHASGFLIGPIDDDERTTIDEPTP